MRRIGRILAAALVLFVEAGAIVSAGDYLCSCSVPYHVIFCTAKDERFRQQRISDENLSVMKRLEKEWDIPMFRLLAASMAANGFALEDAGPETLEKADFLKLEEYLQKEHKKEYEQLLVNYGTIWKDVKYFPVPESCTSPDATVSFEDSWMYERTFGGRRGHEGCDIMADVNKRGYYPVVSMTDGVVEKIGWLTKGGYRIGIRSASGGYYYYAHLYRYAKKYEAGDTVQAGELLGYMGDSGYGDEGTVGQFAVHLHVGIYLNDEKGEEVSVNPYPVLKYFQQKTLQYTY